MDFLVNGIPVPGATPLDLDEAEGLIPSLSTQGELNEFEALNIIEATRWARRNRRIRSDLLNPETLKILHRQMFGDTWRWAGSYRITQKSIGVEAFRISTDLKNLTEDVKVWLEFESYPKEEIAIRFHHRLVEIHAFANGNGRHARLATDLLCEQLGIPLFSWGSGNLIRPTETRSQYIAALRAADAHNYAPLSAFVRS